MTTTPGALFLPGQIVCTPGALDTLRAEGLSGVVLLKRHLHGDWGDLCEADKHENEISLKEGFRVMSAYTLPRTGVKLWVITEADRSATTFLLPEEY